MKKIVLGILVAGNVALLLLLPVPSKTEASLNRILLKPPYSASEQATQMHRSLLIADLHADTLLWNRDLLQPSARGHVDVPRLIAGNVALQAFTVVTKVPRGMNIVRNDDRSNAVTPLVIAQRWPFATWHSLTARALHQAHRLDDAAARSGGKLCVIRTAVDLRRYLERRRTEPAITAGFLGIEGAHALEGDPGNLDVLFDAGFRMMSLTHFFDTFAGGSSSGLQQGGLTAQGEQLVRRMEQRGMLVDLSHASSATIDSVLSIATRPVVVSHIGVKATCNNSRNLTDDQMRRIGANGGLIGIGYFYAATCDVGLKAIVRAIRAAVDAAGVEHVALGSDFDGGTALPFDATGLALLTEALLNDGFNERELRGIMGWNAVDLLLRALPQDH